MDPRHGARRVSTLRVLFLSRQPFHTLDRSSSEPSRSYVPLGDVVQDLYSTDPAQETCPRYAGL